MRRGLPFEVVAVMAVLVASAVLVRTVAEALPPPHHVDARQPFETQEGVRLGMTVPQIVHILGCTKFYYPDPSYARFGLNRHVAFDVNGNAISITWDTLRQGDNLIVPHGGTMDRVRMCLEEPSRWQSGDEGPFLVTTGDDAGTRIQFNTAGERVVFVQFSAAPAHPSQTTRPLSPPPRAGR